MKTKFSFKNLLQEKQRPLIMGILNITPDSFSDGGENNAPQKAVEKLKELEKDGADIIDIGACSTAPMNELASAEEELARLEILEELVKIASVPVSIDTFRPEVAEFALKKGVSIVNDESGKFSEEMAECVKKYGAGWIFMHTGGKSSKEKGEYEAGIVNAVKDFFADMKEKAVDFGIDEDSLCYDCGIGFGKTRVQDLELLGACSELSEFSPLLIGASRKRIIGEITNRKEPKERIVGSVSAAAVCAFSGAEIVRVHDVKETLDAIKVADAVRKGRIL